MIGVRWSVRMGIRLEIFEYDYENMADLRIGKM